MINSYIIFHRPFHRIFAVAMFYYCLQVTNSIIKTETYTRKSEPSALPAFLYICLHFKKVIIFKLTVFSLKNIAILFLSLLCARKIT